MSNLKSVSLTEIVKSASRFPIELRDLLELAVQNVMQMENFDEIMNRNEADPENFDGQIEKQIRKLLPNATIHGNKRIVEKELKFDNDIVIESNDYRVVIEIEKGTKARFEFDILKMMLFASESRKSGKTLRCFGVFIIPTDNIVISSISGNARESSFKYLKRIFRFIGRIDQKLLDDILLIPYWKSEPTEIVDSPVQRTGKDKPVVNIIFLKEGCSLVDDSTFSRYLPKSQLESVKSLRALLAEKIPDLKEKFNIGSKYLGYKRNGEPADCLYVYFQKKRIVVDIRVSRDNEKTLQSAGFEVKFRNNYQGKAGWLTGWHIPYNELITKENFILNFMLKAFE